jgi:1,4-alpha-glucan branching enzyme
MANIPVTFTYITSVFGNPFPGFDATLLGSWDGDGRYNANWVSVPMAQQPNDDGGICFTAKAMLDENESGKTFNWGVRFGDARGNTFWGIATEVSDPLSKDCHCSFVFEGKAQAEHYYLTHCRRLGANKYLKADGSWGVRFAVWAPNARNVEMVFGSIFDMDDTKKNLVKPGKSLLKVSIGGGYIYNDGTGIHPDFAPVPMNSGKNGVWETPAEHPSLSGGLANLDHRPYMYRITRDDGSVVFRTDLYSRCQIGFGAKDPTADSEFYPDKKPWSGLLSDLNGRVSCSVTVDPEMVTAKFDEPYWPEKFITQETFWIDEFTEKSLPQQINDLNIYELHLGALDFCSDKPGTLQDAIALLDHLQALNVNAVELLPLSEFGGGPENWGYATSHYSAIEYGGGGRDKFKYFIKECHRRGMAVIMDVVYNHFAHDAERAEFNYDSTNPESNIYYWYEGKPSDYSFPEGGYVDNMSTDRAPRYWEEIVRKMFISSAVTLLREFHVDGFRVDQTTSIHGYNVLHANGQPVPMANIYGAKFLRELGRTLRLFKPNVFLMAEDHSDWDQVTLPVAAGGMGFDARWYSLFYHHLSGDTNSGGTAKLLYNAARSFGHGPLQMDWFAGALDASKYGKVVYNESHDEAGNSEGPFLDPNWDGKEKSKQYTSHRSIVVAVNDAPLVGDTRKCAEARCRFAWGVTALSAGVPMTLFGEEVGATKRFKYNAVLRNKEDIVGMALGTGKNLFKFYSDLNALRAAHTGLRSRNIDVVHVHNDNRVIAFKRWDDNQAFLVVATLADQPYVNGYTIRCESIESGGWREVFNSDSSLYGGDNLGNNGDTLACNHGLITVVIPASGFVLLSKIH